MAQLENDEVFEGFWSGGQAGAEKGGQIGGPWGMLIGGIIGHAKGTAQGVKARDARKAYEKAEKGVNPVDPDQLALVNKFRRQGQFYRSGADAASAFAMQNQGNTLAQTQANIRRLGGGTSEILRAQQAANPGIANIGAQAAQRADQFLGLEAAQVNMIAEKKYQRQRELRNQAMARAAQLKQDLNNQSSGAQANMPGMMGMFGKGNNQKNAPQQTSFQNNAPAMSKGVDNSYAAPQLSYSPTPTQPRVQQQPSLWQNNWTNYQ